MKALGTGALARSTLHVAFFTRMFERLLRREFHIVHLAGRPTATVTAAPRLIVYSNHPSWWDGVIFAFLARRLFAGRPAYVPVDAATMRRYGFFARVGAFAVEQNSVKGARHFLAGCKSVLSDPQALLFVTAQGRFADVRERPLGLAPGVAHLTRLHPDTTLLPLAIEYAHRDERRPEVFIRFGETLHATSLTGGISERNTRLESQLETTMNVLARDIVENDTQAFTTLVQGRASVHFAYENWRRIRGLATGEVFAPGHRG